MSCRSAAGTCDAVPSGAVSVTSHGAAPTDLGFHTLWWLQYGYLQQGRFVAARALIDTARAVLAGVDWKTSDAIDARYAEAQLRFSYARESGDWSVYGGQVPALAPPNAKDSSDRTAYFVAADAYQVAFVAAQLGDTIRANAVAATLPPRAAISRNEIVAMVARARGDTATWIAQLQAAAKADETRVHLGPPSVFPPHELLGAALLAVGRAKEAIAAYEKELDAARTQAAKLVELRHFSGLSVHESAQALGILRTSGSEVDAAGRCEFIACL
jgi:tetratricopeptide (TPR) repeat protein